VVDMPLVKIPIDEAWDKDNPTWVPIPPTEFHCKLQCCTVITMPLRIHKASSIHKGQGISCGKGLANERVVVGLAGKGGSAGLDLVALSRATEITALAVYDDIPITREQLFKIGKGKGYDKKREFESKLGDLQAKTVPPMIALITLEDTSEVKTFSGGCKQLIEWFHSVQDALPPPENQLDADALETATKDFLDSLKEPPSVETVVAKAPSVLVKKLSASAKKRLAQSNKPVTRRTSARSCSVLAHCTARPVVRRPPVASGMQIAATALAKAMGDLPHSSHDFISQHFHLLDMPGDGSCGYHAIIQGLRQHGLYSSPCSMTAFRQQIYDHGMEQKARMLLWPAYFGRGNTSDGSSSYFERNL
jgi:hypothetical protein